MFHFLGRLAVTHPWKIVAAWLAAAVALYVLAPSWESKAHDEDIRFLPARCASVRGHHLLQKAFPSELDSSRITFALERRDVALAARDLALIDQLVGDLEKLRQAEPDLRISKVISCKDPLIGKRLTSADGHCTLIQVLLETPYLALQTRSTVDRTEAVLRERLERAGFETPELLTTGAAGVGRDLIEASGNSLERTTLATVLLVVIILVLVYRAPLLALVPLLTLLVSVFVALRMLAILAQVPGIHLVNVSQIFTVVLLYGAGTDYCLFLISRYREELEEGHACSEALARSVAAVGAALAASAGTVICGLSLMGFAEFAKVRCAGPAIALALAIALAGSLTLTPAFLKLFGLRVFWPKKAHRPGLVPAAAARPGLWQRWLQGGLWDWLSRRVTAHPLLIWSVSIVVLLPFFIFGLDTVARCKPTGELSPESASIRGMEAIARHFTAGETGPLTVLLVSAIDWESADGKQLLAQVSADLGRLSNVAEVRSLTQPLGRPLPANPPIPGGTGGGLFGGLLRGLGRDLANLVSQGNQAARKYYLATVPKEAGREYVTRLDVVFESDPFDPASSATLEQIETLLADQLPRCGVPVGWVQPEYYGVTVYSRDMAAVAKSDRLRVNVLVMAGIFVILVVLVQHVWIAAYLLFTVLLSYFATLGATALVGSWISGYPMGEMDWRVPFFLFTILAAVGEDYNILLVSRILQERKFRGNREGIRHGLARTGGTITACGLIMAGTFGTLMLGGLNTLVQIGFALAFGVLLDTFLVRPFLVPAFLLLIWKDPTPAALAGKVAAPLRRSA